MRGAGERRSVRSRSRARVTVREPRQCHRALAGNLGKIGEDVRRQKCLVIQKSAAHEIPNLGVSPLAAAVTHKVRVINDLSFEVQSREKKGGLNGDTDLDIVPQCLCAESLPKLLDELVTLRKKSLEKRILMRGRCVRRFWERASSSRQNLYILLNRRSGSNWFSSDVRMVGIAGFLGRHVGGGRTRALQHNDRISSVVRRRTIIDDPRKGGGALGRRKTNTITAGRRRQNSQRRGGIRPILHSRVRRRLPANQGTAL